MQHLSRKTDELLHLIEVAKRRMHENLMYLRTQRSPIPIQQTHKYYRKTLLSRQKLSISNISLKGDFS